MFMAVSVLPEQRLPMSMSMRIPPFFFNYRTEKVNVTVFLLKRSGAG